MKLLLAAWDRLLIYLPIAAMGALALGTYWLAQNAPKPVAAAVTRALRYEPDYFMKDFSVTTLAETGRLKSEVFGVAARHFPDSDTLEIDRIRVRSFDQQGRLTVATANRARTNSDQSEVELFGQALIVRETTLDQSGHRAPRVEFRGEYLHVWIEAERLKSDLPVELRRGEDVFVGDTMDYDNSSRVMLMRGRVKGTLMPPKRR